MLEIVRQEVRHYQRTIETANKSEKVFGQLAGKHCGNFVAATEEVDGERINVCEHSAHPYAKGALAECIVNLCPLCK